MHFSLRPAFIYFSLVPFALPFSSFSFIFQCLTHSYTLSPLGFMCSFICLFCWFLCFSHRFTFVFTFIAFSSLSSVLISMQTTNSRTCHLSVYFLSLLHLYSGNLHSSSLFFKRPLLLQFSLSFFHRSFFWSFLTQTLTHSFQGSLCALRHSLVFGLNGSFNEFLLCVFIFFLLFAVFVFH